MKDARKIARLVVGAIVLIAAAWAIQDSRVADAAATAPTGAEVWASASTQRVVGDSVVVSVNADAQQEDSSPQAADDRDDTRVRVEVFTALTAVVAVGVGFLGYLLRRRLGLVKPPPNPEDIHH